MSDYTCSGLNSPINWYERLMLAADVDTAGLGQLDTDEAQAALDEITRLRALNAELVEALHNARSFVRLFTDDGATVCLVQIDAALHRAKEQPHDCTGGSDG